MPLRITVPLHLVIFYLKFYNATFTPKKLQPKFGGEAKREYKPKFEGEAKREYKPRAENEPAREFTPRVKTDAPKYPVARPKFKKTPAAANVGGDVPFFKSKKSAWKGKK